MAINGRFLAVAEPTGVQRVARELVRELGERRDEIAALFGASARVVAPRTANADGIGLPLDARGQLAGHAWEQIELPWRAGGSLLLNLCNLAPLAARGGVTMIHDAQAFTAPDSYSAAFGIFYRTAQPIIGRRAARILTVSHSAARDLVRHGIAAEQRIGIVPNGVDHITRVAPDRAVVDRLGLTAGRYVVAAASAAPHKNRRVLFAAFGDPALADLQLVLVGGGALPTSRPPNVVAAGRPDDAALAALMAEALCYAMPSTTEGFGLPPLEAMALGCPAIVAPCGALPETCGAAALHADPHAPAEWVATIRALADDRALRAARRGAGLAHVQGLTWRAAGDALLRELAAIR